MILCVAHYPGHRINLIDVNSTSASFEVEVAGHTDNYILCDVIEISPANAAIDLYPTDVPRKPGIVYADGLQPETCYILTTVCCDLYRSSPYTKTGRDCYRGSEDFCTGTFLLLQVRFLVWCLLKSDFH